MATSRASSEIEGFGPRRFRWALSGGLLPGFHGVERGPGKTPGRTDPLLGGRPNPCRERWRHSSAATSGPKGRTSPSWPPAVPPADQLPDPLHGDVQFRLHRIALAFLERGIDPGDRLLTPLLEPENLHAQLPRQKLPARHAKAAGQPHACASPSTAGQVPAGLPAKPGPGKTWTSQARPRLPQAHQQQLCSQNCRSCSGPPWTLRSAFGGEAGAKLFETGFRDRLGLARDRSPESGPATPGALCRGQSGRRQGA